MAEWKSIKPGDVYIRNQDGGRVVVMAVVNGWLMMRRPTCIPFCEFWRDLAKNYTPEKEP